MMKVIFFGTPDFVIPVADSILKTKNLPAGRQDLKLVAIVTNPDRPAGRSQIPTPSPIKQWATQQNIPVLTPKILDDGFKFQVSSLKPQVGILAAYGKIIPQEVIDLFPKGILVIHPSLLPIYRGASPLQAAIMSGDKETGVSLIQMDKKMDHGPIIVQFKEEIKSDDTAGSLTKRLFEKTAPVLMSLMSHISLMQPIPQNHALATYTKLLTKDDGKIDWNWQPEKIEKFIRAMAPWPGAWTILRQGFGGQAKRLKILKAHLKPILDRNSLAKLVIEKVQLESKKPVSYEDFQKGYPEAKLF